MKKIKGLDEKLASFQDDTSVDILSQMPTYRKMFKAALGMGIAKDGENAIDLVQIGLKLSLEGTEIILEDEEFKLLKERCDKNPSQWIAHFHGQVMIKLKESEEIKK